MQPAVPLTVAIAALSVAPAVAQKRTKLYADQAGGYECRIPWWMGPVPTKPGDQQVLAKFQGKRKVDRGDYKGTRELTVHIIRIRGNTPTTGQETEKDSEEPGTLVERRVAALNNARNITDHISARFGRDASENTELLRRRALKGKNGVEFKVYDVGSGPYIRAFVQESPSQTFGLVAFGSVGAFQKEIYQIARSLDDQVRRSLRDDDEQKDPYEDSDLLDIERRRKVRAELTHGWEAFDSDHFILVTNVGSSRLIERMLTDLEIMRATYSERFPPAEEANIDVVSTVRVCDGYEDYIRYAGKQLYGTGGYWNFVEEELVLFNPERRVPKALRWVQKVDPIAVLYHEAMHQYFFYSNAAVSPASWFNEGYGEVFGGAVLNRRKHEVKKIGVNAGRIPLIRLDKKKKNPRPELNKLLRMLQPQFYSYDPLRNYAYSWSFCYFLEKERAKSKRNRNEQWAQLPDKYITELRKATAEAKKSMPADAPKDWISSKRFEIQKTAIRATLKGVDMDELQQAWEKFVYHL